jgi:hypothetical protein
LEWNPIEWSPAERRNFAFLRGCSNETEVLADAIERAVLESRPSPTSGATVLDFGAGCDLSDRLRVSFEHYVPLPIDGRETARRLLRGLEMNGADIVPEFDACIFSHVIPYVVDLDRTFAILAGRSSESGVGVAVLCADEGDQHEVGRLAGAYDPRYTRTHDHAERFARFLTDRAVPFRSFGVLSEAVVATREAALRILAFFVGREDPCLLSRLGSHLTPDADGAFRLSSGHRVFSWHMDAFAHLAEGTMTGESAR